MPEIYVDDSRYETFKQCEIRRPSPRGYFFDIVWIKGAMAKKTARLMDSAGNEWIIFEVFGTKKLPGAGRFDFKYAT